MLIVITAILLLVPTYVKTYQNVYIKHVQLNVCFSTFNKAAEILSYISTGHTVHKDLTQPLRALEIKHPMILKK